MDTGYPALITEPLSAPIDPKTQKPMATFGTPETQPDLSNQESSDSQATVTPVV